jgi:hypothetical protein
MELLQALYKELQDVAIQERAPGMEGRFMHMILTPRESVVQAHAAAVAASAAAAPGAQAPPAQTAPAPPAQAAPAHAPPTPQAPQPARAVREGA